MVSRPPYDQMAPQLCQFYVPGEPSKRHFVKKHGLVATKNTVQIKGKSQFVLFVSDSDSNTNRINWNFNATRVPPRPGQRQESRGQRLEARSRTRRRVLARLVRKVQLKSHLNLIVIPVGCGVDLGSKSASFVL